MSIAGILFDLDGTLYVDGVPIPGAVEAVATLRRRGIPVGFVTNTTSRSRRQLAERLTGIGIPAEPRQIATALRAGAEYLQRRGVRRIAPLVRERALEDLASFELTQDSPEIVVVGDLDDRWTYDVLDRAFRQLMDGAELVALSRDRYWLKADRLVLDCGPFVAALEYATGKTATVCGKPSAAFFHAALQALGPEFTERPGDVLMVGDDVWGDIQGAQYAGLATCLVRTGKFREEILAKSGVEPDQVLDSVTEIAGLL